MTTNNNTTKQNRTATERRITLSGTEFIIRQPSTGKTATKWGATRYQHTITIKANDVSKRFSFYGSVDGYEKGKDQLSKSDLVYVLDCVISDAIAGAYTCKDFFAEFRYEDPCVCIEAYRGCKDAFRTLDDMGICEEDLYEIENELREMGVV